MSESERPETDEPRTSPAPAKASTRVKSHRGGGAKRADPVRVPTRRRGASELGEVAALLARAVREAVASATQQQAAASSPAVARTRRRGGRASARPRRGDGSAGRFAEENMRRRQRDLETREERVARLEQQLLLKQSSAHSCASATTYSEEDNSQQSVGEDGGRGDGRDVPSVAGSVASSVASSAASSSVAGASRARRAVPAPSAVRVAHTAGAASAAAVSSGGSGGRRAMRHDRHRQGVRGGCRFRRRNCRARRRNEASWCDVCRADSSRCRCERRTTSTTSCDHRGRCSTTVQNEVVRSHERERTCETCCALPCRCDRGRGHRRCAPPYGCGRAKSPLCQYRRVLQPVCGPLGCTLAETDLLTCRSRPGWAPGGIAVPYPAPCGPAAPAFGPPPFLGGVPPPPVAVPPALPGAPCGFPPMSVPAPLPAPLAAACGPPDNLNGNLIAFNERTLHAPDIAATAVAYL